MQKTEAQKQLEQEVKKNLRRIKRFVKSAEKRGYTFSETAIPTLPKKITEKTLKRFEEIRPEQLYKKSVYVSPTGTKVKGVQRRAEERSIVSKKAWATRKRFYDERGYKHDAKPTEDYAPSKSNMVKDWIDEQIANWSPKHEWSKALTILKTRDKNRLASIFYGSITQYGDDEIAIRCEQNAIELYAIVDKVLYESGDSFKQTGREGVDRALSRFAAILKGSPLTIAESIAFTEAGEALGSYEP